jgi:hypothetical protein
MTWHGTNPQAGLPEERDVSRYAAETARSTREMIHRCCTSMVGQLTPSGGGGRHRCCVSAGQGFFLNSTHFDWTGTRADLHGHRVQVGGRVPVARQLRRVGRCMPARGAADSRVLAGLRGDARAQRRVTSDRPSLPADPKGVAEPTAAPGPSRRAELAPCVSQPGPGPRIRSGRRRSRRCRSGGPRGMRRGRRRAAVRALLRCRLE